MSASVYISHLQHPNALASCSRLICQTKTIASTGRSRTATAYNRGPRQPAKVAAGCLAELPAPARRTGHVSVEIAIKLAQQPMQCSAQQSTPDNKQSRSTCHGQDAAPCLIKARSSRAPVSSSCALVWASRGRAAPCSSTHAALGLHSSSGSSLTVGTSAISKLATLAPSRHELGLTAEGLLRAFVRCWTPSDQLGCSRPAACRGLPNTAKCMCRRKQSHVC